MEERYARLKIPLSVVLIVAAAILLSFSSINILRDPSKLPVLRQPSFSFPDTYNAQLEDLSRILSPVRNLPPQIGLKYLSDREDKKQFEFVQAVLAPRPIGPSVPSPYILVISANPQWLSAQSELKDARPLMLLPWHITIFTRDSAK